MVYTICQTDKIIRTYKDRVGQPLSADDFSRWETAIIRLTTNAGAALRNLAGKINRQECRYPVGEIVTDDGKALVKTIIVTYSPLLDSVIPNNENIAEAVTNREKLFDRIVNLCIERNRWRNEYEIYQIAKALQSYPEHLYASLFHIRVTAHDKDEERVITTPRDLITDYANSDMWSPAELEFLKLYHHRTLSLESITSGIEAEQQRKAIYGPVKQQLVNV